MKTRGVNFYILFDYKCEFLTMIRISELNDQFRIQEKQV